MRNDYGVIYDPSAASTSTGGAVGVDVGIPGHVGINLSVNHSKSTSGAWSSNNSIGGNFSFQKDSINKLYEPRYFKVHGEPNIEKERVINEIEAIAPFAYSWKTTIILIRRQRLR